MNTTIEQRLDRIERVLVAQLTDQRDRLDRERVYLKGAHRNHRSERRLTLVEMRIDTITTQLEELGHA